MLICSSSLSSRLQTTRHIGFRRIRVEIVELNIFATDIDHVTHLFGSFVIDGG